MMTPIAEIVGGTLRWHIPHDAYSVPVEYLRGVHMLYAATQSEEYDPLLDDREASVVRMRDMLSRASQADNERLSSEVKMHERSASAKAAELAVLRLALENCRTWAALHRKESWALAILRFCSEAGSGPNPLRTPPPTKEQA